MKEFICKPLDITFYQAVQVGIGEFDIVQSDSIYLYQSSLHLSGRRGVSEICMSMVCIWDIFLFLLEQHRVLKAERNSQCRLFVHKCISIEIYCFKFLPTGDKNWESISKSKIFWSQSWIGIAFCTVKQMLVMMSGDVRHKL